MKFYLMSRGYFEPDNFYFAFVYVWISAYLVKNVAVRVHNFGMPEIRQVISRIQVVFG